MKVIISSTFEDLKDYRQAAVEVVNRYKGVPLAMEFFMSQPQEPKEACEKEIHECDVFVGIYAHRYGFIPGGETKSITQLEYELAKKLKKDCLCFIVDKDLQAALHQRRFLLVLDGLERALRGYSGMEAMYIREKKFHANAGDETQWEKQQREPVHPLAARFLRHLGSGRGKSRVLITSRLMPVSLEDLEGVKHVFLKGLSPGDGVRFLRGEGVKGTRAELEQASKVYDFHPLMLKLLASSIKRSRSKDVQGAFRLNLIHTKAPHKILTTGFNLLTKKEREVASRLSVFRGVFTFDSAKTLFPDIKEDRLRAGP